MSDRFVALVLLAVCGVLYWQSFAIRKPPFAALESLGAEAYPRGVILVLAIFALLLAARGHGPLLPGVDRAALRSWLARYHLPLLSLALFALYALVMGPIGWFAATFAYLVVMQLLLLPRRGPALGYVIAGSLAFTWLLGEAFVRFLHVVLPRAALF